MISASDLKRGKRGISPVIATVILIALVIIISVIIFIWASNFVGDRTEKFGEAIRISCDKVDLDISFTGGSLSVINKGGTVPVYALNIKMENGDIENYEDNEDYVIELSPAQSKIIPNVGSDAKYAIPVLLSDNEEIHVCDEKEFEIL